MFDCYECVHCEKMKDRITDIDRSWCGNKEKGNQHPYKNCQNFKKKKFVEKLWDLFCDWVLA